MEEISPWIQQTVEHLKAHWQKHVPPALALLAALFVIVTVAMVIGFVTMFGSALIGAWLGDAIGSDGLSAIIAVLGMVVGYGSILVLSLAFVPLWVGYSRFTLLLMRGEDPSLGVLAWGFKRAPRVVLLGVIQMALSLVAAMFCYLPAFAVMAAFMFALPAMVTRDIGAIAAIKESWALAKPRLLVLSVLQLVLVIVAMVVGYIPLVGVLASWAFLTVFGLVAYLNLSGQAAILAPPADSDSLQP